jgi:DNA-binding NarL/FixJ family response regulator
MTTSLILADDHAIFREGLATLITRNDDFQLIGQVDNGREAWELITNAKPDVAILDISMPELTGLEVARRAKKAGVATRIIALTMHEDPAAWMQAQQAGISGYVLKDNSFEDLVMAIRIVAAGGTFVTPDVQQKLIELQRKGHSAAALSQREQEVIRLIGLGNSSKQIAQLMEISPRTVDTYRNRLMAKLGLRTVADVVRYAVRTGMVS